MVNLATKPAQEATYREEVAARLMAATMTGNGEISVETHAVLAVQAADALIARLEASA